MLDAWDLPTQIELDGKPYKIRSDYRAVLDILRAFNDGELDDGEKTAVMLEILYIDRIPDKLVPEAVKKGMEFIDAGNQNDGKPHPRLMDWDKDARIIIPSINKVLGYEVRGRELHWYTFLSAYMEIGQGTFATVVEIRNKRARGKKLDNWEAEYLRDNRKMVDLDYQERSEEEKDALRSLLGFKKKG